MTHRVWPVCPVGLWSSFPSSLKHVFDYRQVIGDRSPRELTNPCVVVFQ